ncbi:hypothetical protein V5799_030110 [Amblyomma americanum]|uniref:Uncharacterized protein n=1 Tax=Amblyomma americanum TaxID=6943 RepID=A0AAQ4EPA5_AMBAM
MSVNITCMSSTTIDIENSTHRASQWVSFYNWSRTSWVNGTQNLTAYPGEDEKYNFMNTTYNLGKNEYVVLQ